MSTYKDKLSFLDLTILLLFLFIHAYAKISLISETYTYNVSCILFGLSYWLINIYRIQRSFKKMGFFLDTSKLKKEWDLLLYCLALFVAYTISPFIMLFDLKLTPSEGIVNLTLLICSIIPYRYFFEKFGITCQVVNNLHTKDNSSQKMAA